LSVPASNLSMVEKALATKADAAFLDLEDSVAPDEKADARRHIICALREMDWGGKPKIYRTNTLDTPYFYRDLIEVVEEAGDVLDIVLVPKVERPADLYVLDTLISQVEGAVGVEKGKVKVQAQIENAPGLANVNRIACASARLEVLHFGPGDYAASLGIPQTSIGTMDEWDEAYPGHRFHYAMHRIVVAARAANLRVVEGPVADYKDEEGLRKSCRIARSIGFDGKWCIRPNQLETVNEVFSPTETELEWANKVVSAYEETNAAGSGSVSVDGQMVDAASIKIARRLLDLAQE
jgi:citrate lyase subunit beta / citryl-CoA lyase